MTFQSLGRDSVGWDPGGWERVDRFTRKFQSLGRDSVGWDAIRRLDASLELLVSIPRSGFCGVGPP